MSIGKYGSGGATWGEDAVLRLLGPVELVAAGQALDLGPPKRRAVFAALAVDAGHPVSAGTLVDRVWDERPPAEARSAVYAHLARIRKALAEAARLSRLPLRLDRRNGGYLLDVDPDLVDLHRFRRLVDRAREPYQAEDRRAEMLREALALWRGEPLAGLSGSWVERVRQGCRQLRLDALVAWAEAELRVGDHAAVIGQLPDAIAEYPLVEPLTAALIRALYAAGRTAEALDCFFAIRQRLVEELGVDPGAELQGLHQAILRGELEQRPGPVAPPRPAVPAQLPVDVRGFTGRDSELAQLDRIRGAADQQPAAVAVVSGTAGVGKTALAVHWAHRVADRFPDGQLYVNLRGFDSVGRVMEPAEAVRGLLDGLGVPPERVPPTLDAQTALYRSLLADRRMLILLDNARDAEQARPLLPGTSTALVVVTSRHLLTPLVAAEGAEPLTLDVLSTVEARELLGRRLGPGRVAAEPEAVDAIIAACARLPLALCVAAARARQTHFPLAALAEELGEAGDRLDVLDAGDPASQVRAVFSWSYKALPPAAARLFRLLGLHPGPDISVAAASSLAGASRQETRRLLTDLARANLLVEHVPGRYAFHDLLHAYASDLTRSHDPEGERRAATGRLVDHYLHTAHAADRLVYPHRDPIPLALGPHRPGTSPEHLANFEEAMSWFGAEHPVLLAVLRQAADAGLDAHAWQLAWATSTFLDRRGFWHERAAAWHTAVDAARRVGDQAAQASALRIVGHTDTRLGRYDDAYVHLRHALDLFRRGGDPAGQARVEHNLAMLRERQGDLRPALGHAQRALTGYEVAGHLRGQAHALNAVGWYHALLGDHTQALTWCERALILAQKIGDREAEAVTWDSLGYAHHGAGHHTRAADCYQHALVLLRDVGDRYYEANTLTRLGDSYRDAGDPRAGAAWLEALAILDELGHPDADRVRARLR
jgi:DNA-binding SARP family transcriptional activator/tetratricopeptide (TPR) repeat protein